MSYAVEEVVEVWTGAATGSPYPPPRDAKWEQAKVLEVKGDALWITWLSSRPGCPWVPLAAVRKLES